MTNEDKKTAAMKATLEIARVIIEAVKASDKTTGAPGGHLYAACMNIMSLDQFESLMGMLVRVGFLEKRGQCYFWLKDL